MLSETPSGAGIQKRWLIPPQDEHDGSLHWVLLTQGPGEGQAREHLGWPGFPTLGKSAILCINLGTLGDSGENKLVPKPG